MARFFNKKTEGVVIEFLRMRAGWPPIIITFDLGLFATNAMAIHDGEAIP